MKTLPISFTAPLVARIRAGEIVQTRRPRGLFDKLQPGDLLWLREPFHLDQRFDHVSPSQALTMFPDQRIAFTADGTPPEHFGRRRFARELPRIAHRAHLRVGLVRLEQLHNVTDADARAEGYPDRAAYRTAWDELHAPGTRTITGDATRWADNPAVTVIAFTFIDQPIAQLVRQLVDAA